MLTRGIREFVNRDWKSARQSKDDYWAARIDRLGALEGLRIADELRQQAIDRDPSWPDAADRCQDLQSHIRLSALFRRAGTACRS